MFAKRVYYTTGSYWFQIHRSIRRSRTNHGRRLHATKLAGGSVRACLPWTACGSHVRAVFGHARDGFRNRGPRPGDSRAPPGALKEEGRAGDRRFHCFQGSDSCPKGIASSDRSTATYAPDTDARGANATPADFNPPPPPLPPPPPPRNLSIAPSPPPKQNLQLRAKPNLSSALLPGCIIFKNYASSSSRGVELALFALNE